MARDGCDCAICGQLLSRKVQDPTCRDYITFDHVVPRSRGGLDTLDNMRLAHRSCNLARGNDPVMPEHEGDRLSETRP